MSSHRWRWRPQRFGKTFSPSRCGPSSRTDYTAELAGVPAIPVLVIAGSVDPIYPTDVVHERAGIENPHATVTILDGGHLLPQECPRDLAALLHEFLTTNDV